MIFNNLQRINFILTLMIIVFNKYHRTGNDFIIIDNRTEVINHGDSILINRLCDHRFGRGVEKETISCGTGVTASAIASALPGQIDTNPVREMTKGGNLSVSFGIDGECITDIWLSGQVTFVFEGIIKI
jgi:diaminopimelate epimerase